MAIERANVPGIVTITNVNIVEEGGVGDVQVPLFRSYLVHTLPVGESLELHVATSEELVFYMDSVASDLLTVTFVAEEAVGVDDI